MPLGPFKVEYIRADSTIPQKSGYETKARLLNAPRAHNIPVAGISYRQSAAEAVIRTSITTRGLEKRAELIYESTNKFDPLAVAVYIFGLQVGYLPKGLCAEYRTALSYVIPEGMPHIPMFCPFIFVGGGVDIHIGVRLALPSSLRAAKARTRTVAVSRGKNRVQYDPKMFEKA